MHDEEITRMRTIRGETESFSIPKGLHQESTLIPYPFTLVADELTRHIQEEDPCCMLFIENIVLVNKIGKEMVLN